ncbi:protein RarD [Staphylococcus aureus VET0403R]
MNTEYKKGIFLSLSAYILWGILPIYWQFVDAIGAFEILAFRIIFSVIFMIFILAVGQKQRNAFQRDMNQLLAKPIQLLAIVVAGYVITLNWGTFIWAVTNGHVLQTSLGYYINPLVSILLALIFLKERFNKFEWLAILFAFIGVLYMTLKIGEFPIVSIILALSFGTYGLLKK